MKTFIKLLLGLFALIVVVLIAAVIMVATLDPNEHKDWISKKAQEYSGRELVLDGDIKVGFYPWLGLEANKVTVGNAAGFTEAPFLYTEYINLRIKLMPIFKDQYEIDTVSIHGAKLNLARNKEGTSNWDDLVAGEKDKDAAAFPLAAVVLGGVDVKNASLNWQDHGADINYKIENINISTDELKYGEPIKLDLTAEIDANKPAVNGDIALSGTVAYDIDKQQYAIKPLDFVAHIKGENIPGGETTASLSVAIDLDLDADTAKLTDLNLDALDTKVSGSLSAARIQTPEPSVQATIDVSGADLAQLFKVAEVEPLASQIAELSDRSFTLQTSFDADMERGDVDVSRLALAMLGATVNGDVKMRNLLSETPGYEGQLKAAGPDLPTLMQVLGQFQGGKDSAIKEYGQKFARLKDKAFKIDAGFNADLKSGDIDVPTLDVDALGIKITGKLNARDMQSDKGIVNGNLNIRGRKLARLLRALDQAPLSGVLKTIDVKVGISGNAGNLNLKPMIIRASVASEQVAGDAVDVSLNADTNINLDKETLSMAGLTLKGLGLNVTGNVKGTKILQSPEVAGNIKIDSFNLRALMRKLNQKPPRTTDRKVLKNVALDTEFSGSAKKIKLKNIALTLDDSNISGDFTIRNFAQPAYRFDLNVDRINADRYLPPTSKSEAQQTVTPETAAGAIVQLPTETLQALDVNGKLSIGSLVISRAKMTNLKLNLVAKEGKVNLDPVSASLYRGTYVGKINIDANGKLPKLVVNSSIKGVQIEPLLKDVTGEAMLVGKTNLSIAVVARGKDSEAFKKTLSGQAELKVTNGIVRGVDVSRALEQVEIMIESKRFGKVNTEGDTAFKRLTGTLPINAGIVTNEDLLMKAPGFKVRGRGMLANLVDMTWKYDLQVGVDKRSVSQNEQTYNIGDYTIPIKCRGKIAGENCKPDKMNLAGTAVKKIILDKLMRPGSDTSAETNATDKNSDPGQELLDKALKSIFK